MGECRKREVEEEADMEVSSSDNSKTNEAFDTELNLNVRTQTRSMCALKI